MSAAKHTPGPWRLRPSSGGRPAIIYGNDGWPVANVATYHGRVEPGQQDANANLIAAAPELLAVAQLTLEWLQRSGSLFPMIRRELAATVAKATGQQGGAA